MRKILFLVEHDVGKVGTNFIAFIVELGQEYFRFLICRESFVGGYSCSGDD